MNPILVIAGTNRPGAHALELARHVHALYMSCSVPAEIYSLSQMPQELFLPTAYAQKPPVWLAVQQRIVAASGLHVITPEYNGSLPGVLKYFIDMLKFPESFEHKPVAFVGEAAGMWGGLRPVEQLQAIFGYRNAYIYPDRVFIPQVNTRLDAGGSLTDPVIADRLQTQATGFASFARKLTAL